MNDTVREHVKGCKLLVRVGQEPFERGEGKQERDRNRRGIEG